MASAELTETKVQFEAVFSRLREEAGERDRSRKPMFDEIRDLVAAGFGKLRVPLEYGGLGADLPTLFEFLAEAGRADSNVTQIFRGHFTCVEILRSYPDREIAGYWLRKVADGAVFGNAQTEPAGSTNDFSISTKIRELADGQRVVTGTKFYSTGSIYADYIRVAVVDDDGNRSFAIVSARQPAVRHEDDWDGIGQRLTGSGTTHFDAAPVETNGELSHVRGSLRVLPAFLQTVHLANLTGIARNIVDDAVKLIRTRKRTGFYALSDRATDDPAVLAVAGEVYRRSQIADALLARITSEMERVAALDQAGPESTTAYDRLFVDVSAAQVTIVERVLDAATQLFNAAGASAVREAAFLDRHWRNARTLGSHNPIVYKPNLVGDFIVNGAPPASLLDRRRASGESQ